MTANIKQMVLAKMQKSVEAYQTNLTKIRTGRAHAGILDHVLVDYYGSKLPVSQVANLNVSDVNTITVQPFESSLASIIEKAIRDSDLGLNPSSSSGLIRVPMPPLTEQRRRELIKVVKAEAEESKIAIRNIRRDANAELKSKLKEKLITEDDDRRAMDEIQKLTDKHISLIDKLTMDKEQELLKV